MVRILEKSPMISRVRRHTAKESAEIEPPRCDVAVITESDLVLREHMLIIVTKQHLGEYEQFLPQALSDWTYNIDI